MKIHYATLALIAGVSVAFSSCVAPNAGYVSYSAPGGISTGVAWTNASYDADGFPIFGYSYGRPVYGYTAAGAAIFTIGALTALCYVPHWGPASWYHGHYHYPHGIHRVPQPPRYPAGHAPHVRPPAGAHKGPGLPGHAVHNPGLNRPGQFAPQRPSVNRPGSNIAPQRPGWSQPRRPAVQEGNQARPPQANHHMGNVNHGNVQSRPNIHNSAARPGVAANHGGPVTLPAPKNSRPIAPVRSFTGGRPSAASAPSFNRGAAASPGMARSHAAGGFRGGRR